MKRYYIRFYKNLHIRETVIIAASKAEARKILRQREPEAGDIVQIKEI